MSDHRLPDYNPFAKPSPRPPRETTVVFALTRTTAKGVETFSGSRRPIAGTAQVEALYLRNSELFRSQVFASRALADDDLARMQTAVDARWLDTAGVKDPT